MKTTTNCMNTTTTIWKYLANAMLTVALLLVTSSASAQEGVQMPIASLPGGNCLAQEPIATLEFVNCMAVQPQAVITNVVTSLKRNISVNPSAYQVGSGRSFSASQSPISYAPISKSAGSQFATTGITLNSITSTIAGGRQLNSISGSSATLVPPTSGNGNNGSGKPGGLPGGVVIEPIGDFVGIMFVLMLCYCLFLLVRGDAREDKKEEKSSVA